MDERSNEGLAEALPDEYSELADPRLVMEEVVRLLGELHRASTRLGDAIVVAGMPARDWRSTAARLDAISNEFPAVTLDDLLTRLAEFSASTGILWLRGGPAELDRFQDETGILHDVVKPLRSFGQRQRMLPARERGEEPLWKALGDPRVGTPLDLVAKTLRDLVDLDPFIAPVSADVWKELDAERAKAEAAAKRSSTGKSAKVPAAPAPLPAVPSAATPPPTLPSPSTSIPRAAAMSAANASAIEAPKSSDEPAPAHKRLREYLPSAPAVLPRARESRLSQSLQAGGRYLIKRWTVVLTVTVMLVLAIALLTVVTQARPQPTSTAHLTANPTSLALTCTGKNTSASFTLKNTATKSEAWKVTPPKGVTLSAVTGTLASGASATLKLTVATGTKASAQGTLTFTDADGTLAVPYTITC